MQKLILTCNAMGNLDVLYEILLLLCQWWNIEHPGLFLIKIHPVERKLYQIFNGGTTALVYDESYLTQRGMHSWLNPFCNYSLSAINRLIVCLHFRFQRDYKMPRNLGLVGIDRGLSGMLTHVHTNTSPHKPLHSPGWLSTLCWPGVWFDDLQVQKKVWSCMTPNILNATRCH